MKLRGYTLLLALSLGIASGVTGLTGCSGTRTERSTGESIDDTATTGRVKAALHKDVIYKYPDVEVHTFKGTTQLSGFVGTMEQKSKAASIARTVEGVKDVQNNISVKP
jgi:hyperosmotically inducible protein